MTAPRLAILSEVPPAAPPANTVWKHYRGFVATVMGVALEPRTSELLVVFTYSDAAGAPLHLYELHPLGTWARNFTPDF